MPLSSVTILGYNSSGKTSLCNSMLGLIQPMKGNILFDNADIEITILII